MRAPDSPSPDLVHEREASVLGLVAGVDEAGCAPLAGPVVAAAVVLDFRHVPEGINDSKKLSAERREELYGEIAGACLGWAVGIADVARIDAVNILNARLWAMAEAVRALSAAPAVALVDGNRAPKLSCETRLIVGGDARSLSIAAASIIAKVTRDRLMCALDIECPGYGFSRHKGYGTPEHQRALRELGPSIHHRRSFAPVRQMAFVFAAE
ncbi:MAG: ribonuclease HII [Parvibaculaceae bacterium]